MPLLLHTVLVSFLSLIHTRKAHAQSRLYACIQVASDCTVCHMLRCLHAHAHAHERQFFSCNYFQCNNISSCKLQEKLHPVTLVVCKIITLQVTQQLAYI